MPVLLIDCYLDPSGGHPNFLKYLPEDTVVWQAAHQDCPVPSSDVSGVVITGSAACVGDAFPWLRELSRFVRLLIDHRKPCLGVCFGHQLLAHICGGRVEKMAFPEVGWKSVRVVQSSMLWNGVEASFECFLSHEDAVQDLGSKLRLLASSDDCVIQAFEHCERPVWGIQFHPEMPMSECLQLLNLRAEKHPQLSLDLETEQRLLRSNEQLAAQIFHNFIKSMP